jgi:hypothetical protein
LGVTPPVSAFNLRNPSTPGSLSIWRRVAVSIDELCPTPAGGCIGYCNRCGFYNFAIEQEPSKLSRFSDLLA